MAIYYIVTIILIMSLTVMSQLQKISFILFLIVKAIILFLSVKALIECILYCEFLEDNLIKKIES